MELDITKAREQIEKADKEIAVLFEKRMAAAKEVAEYKKVYGIPIEDKAQEKNVIERNKSFINNSEIADYFITLTQCLMDLSKKYQHRLNEGTRIAYNGSQGAFAYIAAEKIFPQCVLVAYPSFESAYNSVKNGECNLAVLPIENSYAGEVGAVIDLMYSGELSVNGVYSLPVTHNLIGCKGAVISGIKTVISHPQALSQCEKYIKKHNLITVTAESTSAAAQKVAALQDETVAAIASAESAEINGLSVIDHDINESKTNATKFAVFSRAFRPKVNYRKDNKFILMFTVNDEAGALAKVLNVIGENGFNMHVLRSRPVKDKDWQYYFYVEIEGDDNSPSGKKMLETLESKCETLKIIGHYSEGGVDIDN